MRTNDSVVVEMLHQRKLGRSNMQTLTHKNQNPT